MNENSTLWEDFFILGTTNHAWTGCPAEIAFKYFLGLRSEDGLKTFTIKPEKGIFRAVDCAFNRHDRLVKVKLSEGEAQVIEEEVYRKPGF